MLRLDLVVSSMSVEGGQCRKRDKAARHFRRYADVYADLTLLKQDRHQIPRAARGLLV